MSRSTARAGGKRARPVGRTAIAAGRSSGVIPVAESAGSGASTPDQAPEATDKRRARSVRSRQALVAATLRSIAEFGLEATTLSRVSQISGLSRGLVAFHFASKDQLIAAALESVEEIYRQSWEQNVRACQLGAADRLAAAIAHDIAFAASRPDLLSLLYAIWGEARGNAIYREQALPWHPRYIDEMAADFIDLLPPGPQRQADARKRARVLNATLYGFWLEAHLDPAGYHENELREQGACLLQALVPGFAGALPVLDLADKQA